MGNMGMGSLAKMSDNPLANILASKFGAANYGSQSAASAML